MKFCSLLLAILACNQALLGSAFVAHNNEGSGFAPTRNQATVHIGVIGATLGHNDQRLTLHSTKESRKAPAMAKKRTISLFFQRILQFPINILAYFVAAVLSRAISHPSVQTALGACIVNGVKQLCADPNLDSYIDQATTTINEDMEDDARELAEALPKLVRGFVQGLTGQSPLTKKS